MASKFEIGLLRVAHINKVYLDSGEIDIVLDYENKQYNISQKENTKRIRIPFPFFSNDGLIIGGYPTEGTSIIVAQKEGGDWCFVSYYPNQQIGDKSSDLNPFDENIINIDPGTLFLRSNPSTQITLSQNSINLGNNSYNLYLNTDENYFSSKLISKFSFTEASRFTEGVVKRDIDGTVAYNIPDEIRLTSLDYESRLTEVGLDPTSRLKKSSSIKNPSFIEKRELLYEFEYDANIKDDITESNLYATSTPDTNL